MLAGLPKFPEAPKPSDVGRVDRMLSRKIRELKDAFEYTASGELQKISADLEILRQVLKPASSYVSGTLPTRKKTASEFQTKMEQLQENLPQVFAKFPATVKTLLVELQLTARLEKGEWDQVADLIAKAVGDGSALDFVSIFEKVVGSFVKEMEAADCLPQEPDQKKATLVEIGQNLSKALKVVSASAPEDTKAPMVTLATLASMVPPPGSKTLEDALGTVLELTSDPGYRVLHESAVGQAFLQLTIAENNRLVALQDAQV